MAPTQADCASMLLKFISRTRYTIKPITLLTCNTHDGLAITMFPLTGSYLFLSHDNEGGEQSQTTSGYKLSTAEAALLTSHFPPSLHSHPEFLTIIQDGPTKAEVREQKW